MTQPNTHHQLDIPTEQLPSWMRRARQSVDWGILLVFLFSLTASWGFILRDSLPHTNRGEHDVYATAEYAQAFRQGVLYPRWSATAMGGYGAPIYNFYPPALPYISALVDVLFADDPVVAIRLVMVVSFLLAGSMCYVLVLRVSGALTAVLASVLYLYSPYINLTAPHLIGDYQGVLLFALYPMALWNLNRLLTFRNPFDLALGAFIYAGFMLIDPRSLCVILMMALPMVVWWRWQSQEAGKRFLGGILRFLIVVCLGLGLSAFFWMPALLEKHQVNWIVSEQNLSDDRLTWAGLLSIGDVIDLQEMNPSPYFNLGWGLMIAIMIFLGLFRVKKWTVRRRNRFVWHSLYLLLGVGLLIAVMLFCADAVWMLSPIVLCLSVGASGLSLWRYKLPQQFQSLLIPIFILMILGLNMMAWLGTRTPHPFGRTDDYARIEYELKGYGNAVLSPMRPLPTYMDAHYMINQTLIDGYQNNDPIRIPNLRLRGDKVANFVYGNSHADRYLVEARGAVLFDILRAYDEGWQAWLDGEPIELKPNPANGLMQVLIPNVMRGQLDIRYALTTPRLWGWVIAGVVMILLVLRTAGRMLRYVTHEQDDDLDYLRHPDARLLAVVTVGFMGVVMLHALPTTTQTLHAREGHQLDYFTGLFLRGESGIEAFAYDYIPRKSYQNGDRVKFDMAWRTNQPLAHNYHVQVSIWSADDSRRWLYQSLGHPGDYPTSRWEVGYYVLDRVDLPLETLPAGTYQIALELMVCEPDCLFDTREVFFGLDGIYTGNRLFLPFVIEIG